MCEFIESEVKQEKCKIETGNKAKIYVNGFLSKSRILSFSLYSNYICGEPYHPLLLFVTKHAFKMFHLFFLVERNSDISYMPMCLQLRRKWKKNPLLLLKSLMCGVQPKKNSHSWVLLCFQRINHFIKLSTQYYSTHPFHLPYNIISSSPFNLSKTKTHIFYIYDSDFIPSVAQSINLFYIYSQNIYYLHVLTFFFSPSPITKQNKMHLHFIYFLQ